jgi:hypothetical protein
MKKLQLINRYRQKIAAGQCQSAGRDHQEIEAWQTNHAAKVC